MEASASTPSQNSGLEIDLKDPPLAAFLAWLIPGAGHIYQGRTGKGILFLVCILGTFLYGFYLGGGHVVYASLRPEDRRLPYLCQVGVGLPALPALVQAMRVRSGKQPLWSGFMAPPNLRGRPNDPQGLPRNHPDELAFWHHQLHAYFELGTVYTMIAGLLNVLAIYDAWSGPLVFMPNAPGGQAKRKREGVHDALPAESQT